MGETKNILQTIKTTVQGIVAPDVRELKVRMGALEEHMRMQFETAQRQSDVQFKAFMAAISQVRTEMELSNFSRMRHWVRGWLLWRPAGSSGVESA